MAGSNYDSVLEQLRAAGFVGRGVDDGLQIGRIVRCKVEGDREKRGWYKLHEVDDGSGDRIIVGSFGVWRGNDQGTRKIEVRKTSLSKDQLTQVRQRIREDAKRAEALRRAEADRAARRARAAWDKCVVDGESEYLDRKQVGQHGVRFSPSGALVIPMMDTVGAIHGLQIIRPRDKAKEKGRPEKEYWPAGLAKKGHFHLLGVPTWIVLVAEGYATAASLHQVTSKPVAVAWDAGNIGPVCQALHARYRSARILICADDDAFAKCQHCAGRIVLVDDPVTCPHCAKDHGRKNTGVTEASTAAVAVGGAYIIPQFADEAARRAKFIDRGIKLTDFNDLQCVESAIVVSNQVDSNLAQLGWSENAARRTTTTSGAGQVALRPIDSRDELLERFALVYGQGGNVFDRSEHCLLSLGDMRDACISRHLHRAWMEDHQRAIVRASEVGFDPTETDPEITCNLWAGWPTTAKSGCCEKLLELLHYMCKTEGNRSREMFDWIMRWLAYPIQHPGAKMKTTLVAHGPQGTGKNLFFEVVMGLYGKYGRMVDQNAIEDKFTDWMSGRLFLIADEVVARSDLYHVKNKLKGIITGDWIRINAKNVAARDEGNHVNLVFMSNEEMPVVLEEDDRRHAVIYTPPPLPPEFYGEVAAELAAGGAAALHHHLLHLDLAGFNEHTKPPLSAAKLTLIELARDSTSRFMFALLDGDIAGIKAVPALSTQVYRLYSTWCQRKRLQGRAHEQAKQRPAAPPRRADRPRTLDRQVRHPERPALHHADRRPR